MVKITPTGEQQAILDAYVAGKHLVVNAGAGTGKTATLKLLGAATPDRTALYIAYNRAIAKDAERSFPRNVTCRTAHSLAFRAVGRRFKHRLDGPRQPARVVAQLLGVDPLRVDASLLLAPTQVARIVTDTVARFCRSADPELGARHVPRVEGIATPQARGQVRAAVVPLARRAWADITRPDGRLKFTHDYYLKLWQLTAPRLEADVVMLDEAQDADPLIADIFERQRDHAQLVAVGDASQAIYCQPSGTMVDVVCRDGGSRPADADRQCAYDTCDRRRDHKASGLCDQHERQLRAGSALADIPHAPRNVTTRRVPIETLSAGDRVVSYNQHKRLGAIRKRGSVVSGVTRRPWHGLLVRVTTSSGDTSAYTPDHHCVVMLGDALRGQWAVYLARRGGHYRVGACEGRYASQGDRFGPLLRAYQEGADAVWVLSTQPTREAARCEETLTQEFHGVPGRCFHSEGGEAWWAGRPSNRQAAADLLAAFGLSVDAPLLDLRDRSLRSGQSGMHTWRTPLVTQARNLLDGMWVLLADRTVSHSRSATVRVSSWEPVKIAQEWFDGEVVSIGVDGDHTYVADGIVTHNSWRGATDALSRLDADVRLQLSESFRFGRAIADEANKWLQILGADLRLTGRAPHPSRIAALPAPDAVLCRTNAGAVAERMSAAEQGRRAALVGGGDQIKALARAALELQRGVPTSHPELMAFASWGQVKEYVEQESAGQDLKAFVQLIDDHGAEAVIATMDRLTDERYAQVVVSTAHKCVHPDTLVETPEGLVPIRSIPDAGVIATPTGARSYHGKFTKACGPVRTITTKHGYEITVSPEHGLTAWRDSAHVRVAADEIRVGDWLRLHLGMTLQPAEPPLLPEPPTVNVRARRYPIPIRMTAALAELLGLFVADGTILGAGDGFRLTKRHHSVVDRFAVLVKELFGYDAKRGFQAGTPKAEVHSSLIGKWLLAVGGTAPHRKRIPDVVLRSPRTMQGAFLRGLFEDGTVNHRDGKVDHIHWENKDPQVVGVVQTMLLRFEIASARRYHHGIGSLYLYGQNARRFAELIGFVASEKNALLDGAEFGEDLHSLIPLTRDELRPLEAAMSITDKQNARARGYISRTVAAKVIDALDDEQCAVLLERLGWHYEPVTAITSGEAETMCMTVPDGARFLQNGFDGWNSKGREWDRVQVAGDFREPKPTRDNPDPEIESAEAMLAYVTVTRARKVLDRGGLAWVDGWVPAPAPAAPQQLAISEPDDLATSDEDHVRRLEEVDREAEPVARVARCPACYGLEVEINADELRCRACGRRTPVATLPQVTYQPTNWLDRRIAQELGLIPQDLEDQEVPA